MTSVSCEPLLAAVADRYQKKDLELVKHAFAVAERWHEGQRRKSGEAYVTHPLAVAMIVAEAGATPEAVCAALLHDLVDDTPYTFALMRAEFGEQVASMVEGLVEALETQPFPQDTDLAPAMMVLVKLADRLHNMRTLRYLAPDKQIRKSRETLELAAPLAHRLGLEAIKWELEELALGVLRPAPATDRRSPAERLRLAWRTIRAVPRLTVTVAPHWVTVVSRVAQTVGIAGALVAVTIPSPILAWLASATSAALLVLACVVLFGRSETPARRLADLIRAWRR